MNPSQKVKMNSPIELIEAIIERFGPRRAGSEAERNAQHYLKERLQTYCSRVEVHEFEDALTAKFSSLRLFCTAYYVSLGLVWVSVPAAFVLALVNSILFFGHFVVYRNWLDFLYPKKKSLNVIGTIEPESEVRSTLIFSGHMDSTPEFIWWYWLKDWGIRLMILSSLAFVLLPVLLVFLWFNGWGQSTEIAYWVFVGLVPATLSFFFIHGKTIVDGAQDNLSGIAVSEGIAQALVGKMKHTRIKMVSFGSEETGLKGSSAYVKQHLNELKKENAYVINLDGILERDEMHLIERELSLFLSHDANLVSQVETVFASHSLNPKRGTIPVGATDAASFSQHGIPALSIVGMSMKGLHPTYHTRLDKVDRLSSETLEAVAKALIEFAQKWDVKQK